MKILFIGSVKSSKIFIEELVNVPDVNIVGIVTKKSSKFNSDFVDISLLKPCKDIPKFYFQTSQAVGELVEFAKQLQPDLIYCFGWSHLLPPELISVPTKYAVGFHPTLLPKNRGRHPIIWALAMGLKETGSTFFQLTEEADKGLIFSQKRIVIDDNDYAEDLYQKIMKTAVPQMLAATKDFLQGKEMPIMQDESEVTYFRKRTKEDGRIDFKKSSHCVYNLIRALSKPYPGAFFSWGEEEISVFKANVSSEESSIPGKILSSTGTSLKVSCGEGTIVLEELEAKSLPNVGDLL